MYYSSIVCKIIERTYYDNLGGLPALMSNFKAKLIGANDWNLLTFSYSSNQAV